MNNHPRNSLRLAGLLVGSILLAGCASTAQLDEVRALAEEAKQTAVAAQRAADDAKSTADRADQKASRALQEAEAANTGWRETNEKIDRMFKKSMQK